MTEWDALSMFIRRKVLISSSHVIFRRCTHFHILSWDTFSFWAKYDLCYVCCLVVKCWHLGALPGLVESQYCFSFAASALLRSSIAEPEPISQFANLPICQFEEHRVAIFATDQDWYRENTATKEGTPRFKIGVTVETLIRYWLLLVLSKEWSDKSIPEEWLRWDENTQCKTKARHSRHIRHTLGEFLAALTKHFSRATIPLVPRRFTTN